MPPTSRTVRTTCTMDCPDSCALEVVVGKDGIERIGAAPTGTTGHPNTQGFICGKVARFGQKTPAFLAIAASMLVSWVVSASAQNLVSNPGFEAGTTGWFGFGPATITAPTDQPHTGSRSALVRNRTATWNGIAQSLAGVLQPGVHYRVSAWTRLTSGEPQPVRLTFQKTDASGTSWAGVAGATASSTGWTQLSGGYTFTVDGALTGLVLYLEGPPAGVDFHADDVVVEVDDWKTRANARIEQIRKRDVRLLIIDPAGNPVPGVAVDVKQTRNRFAFGSAINGNISNPHYAAFFETNFQWAVMENESKWYANEPTRGNVTYTVADRIADYCATHGITLRGHTLFWAVTQFVQPWVTNLSDADLRVHLTNRLDSAVNHFKGTFVHWDVNNEMLHGDYFGQRLGGWVNPWMFRHARSLDPGVKLFVNDYNVVAGDETEAYKRQILGLISSNAPIDGIGAQGHFGATISPASTEARIDSLAEIGLPIWITEYDSENADENIRADNLETLYRIAFSKPAVEGVLMWGFWAGSHWRGPNAAIVNLDWTLNAAGRRYQALLAEWRTANGGPSTANGVYDFRGFHGNYDITLTPPGGQPTSYRIALDPGAGTHTVTMVVPPAQVVGRYVFYNQSAWDGNNAAANAADDAAIAPDKAALRPGGKATFANYTSYHRGLNGVMVDIRGLPGDPSAADFEFRVGMTGTPSSWPAGPTPSQVSVRRGAGIGGSDRISLVWSAGEVKKQWLEVTVRPTSATGLNAPDVFYFGNAVGETGNSAADARVTGTDALRVLANLGLGVPMADRFDINRDGRVGAADRLLVLGNLSALDPLPLVDLGGGATPAARQTFAASGPRLIDVKSEAGGLRVRWLAHGTSVTVWTTDSVAASEWERYECFGDAGAPDQPAEAWLPIDPEAPVRYYRFQAPGEAGDAAP